MSVALQALPGRGTRRLAPRPVAPVRPTPVRPALARPLQARPRVWGGGACGRSVRVRSCTVNAPATVTAAPSEWLLGLSVAGVALVFLLGVAAVVAAFLGFSDAPLGALTRH